MYTDIERLNNIIGDQVSTSNAVVILAEIVKKLLLDVENERSLRAEQCEN